MNAEDFDDFGQFFEEDLGRCGLPETVDILLVREVVERGLRQVRRLLGGLESLRQDGATRAQRRIHLFDQPVEGLEHGCE